MFRAIFRDVSQDFSRCFAMFRKIFRDGFDGRTDGRTDRRTDRRTTDRWTDVSHFLDAKQMSFSSTNLFRKPSKLLFMKCTRPSRDNRYHTVAYADTLTYIYICIHTHRHSLSILSSRNGHGLGLRQESPRGEAPRQESNMIMYR